MRPSPRLAGLLIVVALLLGAHWYVDDARPFGYWTRFADLVLFGGLAVAGAAIVRGRLRNAAITVASLLFSLAAAEAYAVITLEHGPTHIHTPGHLVPDPVLGWRPGQPGIYHHTKLAATTGEVIFDADYTIDAHRNRQVISAPDGPAIAFFGDSMTFGEGLQDADTLPQSFADLTDHRWRVLDFGVPGYGPQQFLRALDTGMFDDLIGRARLLVFQTAPWHAERAACIPDYVARAPRYELVDGRPQFRGTCADRWPQFIRRLFTNSMYSVFLQPVLAGATPARIDLYTAILIHAGEIARRKFQTPTAILYVPDDTYRLGSGYGDEQIKQRLRDGGLMVIDARLDPAAFPGQPLGIPGDGHPTGTANRARAALLRDWLAATEAQSR